MTHGDDEDGGPKFGYLANGMVDPKWKWLETLGYLAGDDPEWDPVFVFAEPELQLLGYTKVHARRLIAEFREKYLYDDDEGRNIRGWPYKTENDIGHEGIMNVGPMIHYVIVLKGSPGKSEYMKWCRSSRVVEHMRAVAAGYAD
jgi:hypothetical protein